MFYTTTFNGFGKYKKSYNASCYGAGHFNIKPFLRSAYIIVALLFLSCIANGQDVLVGLTSNGGPEGKGTAFSIKANGSNYSVMKGFADWGRTPNGDLLQGTDGNFYGMTFNGGAYNYGTIFMMTATGAITVLKQFNYSVDGANPTGELIKGADGNFYGLTTTGGTSGYGTIFKITPAGVYTVIRHLSFADGTGPRGHLVLAKDGNFYGITYHGGSAGAGTIFKMTPAGAFTVLRSLNNTTDGGNSLSSLTEGKDGNLYGITYSGGTFTYGTIFKITTAGVYTVLHHFNANTDGGSAQGDLIQATDGNFYGMCNVGGTGGSGTIFKMAPSGTYSVLRHLSWITDGSNPYGNLYQNNDGNLYGILYGGGPTRNGVFFKITTAGVYTVLHGFAAETEGGNPKGSLIKGTDGKFYALNSEGGINFWGTAFKVTTDGVVTTLASFNGATQGNTPYESLVKGNDSAYYGTTSSGGTYNYGTIFKICGGSTTVLYSFNRPVDGGTPKGSLIKASDGNFYGMTTEGGTNSNGTIFKITPAGKLTVLRNLSSTADGGTPQGSLIQGTDGLLYGMTSTGGTNNSGTIFKISLTGTFAVLHNLVYATEGSASEGSLVQGTDGLLYGMTSNSSRIFKMTTNGATFTVLRTLVSSTDGAAAMGSLIQATDGNFYGTASAGGSFGFGTIFKISSTGTFKVLKHLNPTPDGKTPKGNLLQGSDGNFYGTTSAGGTNNLGTIFKITAAGTYTVLRHFEMIADGGTPFGSLIIAPVNTLVANAQNITTTEDTKKTITLTGSGGQPLAFNILSNPKHGKITGSGANRTYTPAANYAGNDQFTFNVSVGCVASAPAAITISVTPVNDTPVLASIGNKSVVKNSALTFTASATDVDAGQTKTFSLIGAPAGATINANTGVFNWTPTLAGSFTFKVRVTDNGSPVLFDEEQIKVTVTNSFAANTVTQDAALNTEEVKASIFPNPVADKCRVTMTNSEGQVVVRIVDLQGVIMSTGKYNVTGKNGLELNTSKLKPGMYLLQLQTTKGTQTLTFVKR